MSVNEMSIWKLTGRSWYCDWFCCKVVNPCSRFILIWVVIIRASVWGFRTSGLRLTPVFSQSILTVFWCRRRSCATGSLVPMAFLLGQFWAWILSGLWISDAAHPTCRWRCRRASTYCSRLCGSRHGARLLASVDAFFCFWRTTLPLASLVGAVVALSGRCHIAEPCAEGLGHFAFRSWPSAQCSHQCRRILRLCRARLECKP